MSKMSSTAILMLVIICTSAIPTAGQITDQAFENNALYAASKYKRINHIVLVYALYHYST